MNRRSFMIRGAAAAAGVSLLKYSNAYSKSPILENIGIQLYTLRDQLMKDPMSTLKAVQQAGFKQVELADLGSITNMKSTLDDLGLAVNSSHFSPAYLTGDWSALESMGMKKPEKSDFSHILDLASSNDIKYVVFPYIFPQDRGGIDAFKKLTEQLNKAGEKCKEAGVSLCYHNHAFEFQPMDGTSPMQILMEESDPELLNFELDLFWVSVTGFEPADLIKKYSGRIKMVHLKDKKKGTPKVYQENIDKDSFQPAGSGSIDFKKVLKAAKAAKVEYGFVEQDQSPDPLADMKKSIQYLQGLNM